MRPTAILIGGVVLGGGLVVVTACTSTANGEGSSPTATEADTPWTKPCTLDISAEPVVKEGYQRCSEVWSKEKNASRPCMDVATCEAAGGTCTIGNGGSLGDTRCYAVCNPSACPDKAGSCITCDGQPSHCESAKFEKCIPPPVPFVNGYGEPCDKPLPNGCAGPKDCCVDRWNSGSTCYQLMTLGKPNTLSKPDCKLNCKSSVDCDNVYGSENGYCCLDVLAVKPANVSTMLEYSPVGQTAPLKTCVTKQFDTRCTRVPVPKAGTSSSSSSSSSSGGCNYSSCMKACTEAGGTNCGEDCKC